MKYISAEELEALVRAEISNGRIVTEFSPEQFVNSVVNRVDIVKCKDCKHSIKKDCDGLILCKYLCTLKSTVTHLEEHEANYFCADGERKETE